MEIQKPVIGNERAVRAAGNWKGIRNVGNEYLRSLYLEKHGSPILTAKDLLKAERHGVKVPNDHANTIDSVLAEKAPPGKKAEHFILKNKASFKRRYGAKKGEEVLYATAWKKFGESSLNELTNPSMLPPNSPTGATGNQQILTQIVSKLPPAEKTKLDTSLSQQLEPKDTPGQTADIAKKLGTVLSRQPGQPQPNQNQGQMK